MVIVYIGMKKVHTKKYITLCCSNCSYIRLIKNKHTFKYNLKKYLHLILYKEMKKLYGYSARSSILATWRSSGDPWLSVPVSRQVWLFQYLYI
jgi:hypothetical protein